MEAGSLGKAAVRLRMSQPALTKHLRRLEMELGGKLFDRSSRGMQPTELAKCLCSHAQAVNVSIKQALAAINALKTGEHGTVTIAGRPILASEILVDPIARLNKELPGVTVRVATQWTDFVSDIQTGAYDFVVDVLRMDLPIIGLQKKFLFDDPLVLIVRRDHPLTRIRRRSLEDMQHYTWIVQDAGSAHRDQIERLFHVEGVAFPKSIVECLSATFIRAAVLKFDYIGVIAKIALPSDDIGRNSPIAIMDTKSSILNRPIGIIWRENQVLSPAAQFLFHAIEATSREHTRRNERRHSPMLLSCHIKKARM